MLDHALLDQPQRQVLCSSDLEETRAIVGNLMKPHRLDVRGRQQSVRARMHHCHAGRISLSRLAYGAEVEIEPGRLDGFYLVQMPLAGHAQVRNGVQSIDSHRALASVLSPSVTTAMRWSADADQLMVRLDRSLVDGVIGGRFGEQVEAVVPLLFQLGFEWDVSAPWLCALRYLLDSATQEVDFEAHPLLAVQVEQLVVTTLIDVQPHSHRDVLPARDRPALPRHVRKAQEFMHQHCDQPLTIEQLAGLAGASVRSLYAGFKDCCGTSPMQYLRELRLERARLELLDSGSSERSVADVAMHWGFLHLGRFSAEYRRRFGENPSATLRRR